MATASDRLIAAAALALMTGACASYVEPGNPAPALGEAVKYNAALQTIDPDPVHPDGGAEPGSNGDAARAAAERYRKGTVKPIEKVTTTESVSGTGSR